MTYVSHVNFNEAWSQKVETEIDTISISFINLNHLVVSKFNTGRLKDQADIEELQKIQKYRK